MGSYDHQTLELYQAYVLFAISFVGNVIILIIGIVDKIKQRRHRALPRSRVRALYKSGLGKVIKTRNELPRNEVSHEKSDSSPIKPSGRLPEA